MSSTLECYHTCFYFIWKKLIGFARSSVCVISKTCYSSLLDVDECIEGTHDCDNATEYCLNRKGSFNCECTDGYRKKASSCQGKLSMVYFW